MGVEQTYPYANWFAITTSNTVNFSQGQVRGIYIGVGGNLVAITPDGTAVTFIGVVAGSILPISAIRVNLTSTSATSLVGLQ